MQQELEQLTRLYEQYAYRVYNLALRITCDRVAAGRAAERAFLAQMTAEEAAPAPIAAAVAMGLSEAPAEPEQPAAGPEAGVHSAAGSLPPAERAALALSALEEAGPAEIAAALGVGEPSAAGILERAGSGLARRLGAESVEDALAAYSALVWEAPPRELWEGVYARCYRAFALAGEAAAATGEAATAETGAEPGREPTVRGIAASPLAAFLRRAGAPELLRRARAMPRTPRLGLAAVAALALAAGVAVAGYTGGGDSGGTAGALPPAGVGTGKNFRPFGPDGKPIGKQDLEQLRAQERRDLERYTREQANVRLSKQRRAEAARRATKLRRLARKRLIAAKRRALRRKLAAEERRARQRARRQAERERELTRRYEREGSSGGDSTQPRVETESGSPKQQAQEGEKKKDPQSDCISVEGVSAPVCPE